MEVKGEDVLAGFGEDLPEALEIVRQWREFSDEERDAYLNQSSPFAASVARGIQMLSDSLQMEILKDADGNLVVKERDA